MKTLNLFQSFTKLVFIIAGLYLVSLDIVARNGEASNVLWLVKAGIMFLCTYYSVQLVKRLFIYLTK